MFNLSQVDQMYRWMSGVRVVMDGHGEKEEKEKEVGCQSLG